MGKLRLLITGDNTDARRRLKAGLQVCAPHTVIIADNGDKGSIQRERFAGVDCIAAFCRTWDVEGGRLLKSFSEEGVETPVIFMVDSPDDRARKEALDMGAYELLGSNEALERPDIVIRFAEHAAGQRQADSARLAAEKALQEEKNKLDAILNSIGESIIIQDKDFKILFQNKANIELIGDHVGEDCYRAFENRSEICEVCPILDSFKDGKVHREEKCVPTADGELCVELTGSGLTDLDGNIIGGVKVVRDVTERKNLEREKADLIAMVTHDLQSPLSVINGYADLILSKKMQMDQQTQDMVGAVKRSSDKLTGMVEDFLTISRKESGNLSLKKEPVDIGLLVEEAIGETAAVSVKKNISLGAEVAQGMPKPLLDKTLVERAVANLLRNAVSYTPTGGAVTVTADVRASGAGEAIYISVSDTGHGIPLQDRSRVFEKYYRASGSGRFGGTGLGLAVVKVVVEVHGGRVELETEEGRGSTFTIVLPVKGAD